MPVGCSYAVTNYHPTKSAELHYVLVIKDPLEEEVATGSASMASTL